MTIPNPNKPTMEEMLPDHGIPNPHGEKYWHRDNTKDLWISARAELMGFASHLIRTGSAITGDQILMAVAAGDWRLYSLEPTKEANRGQLPKQQEE
jgi:hypothetical protein